MGQWAKSVAPVSGTKRHRCLRPFNVGGTAFSFDRRHTPGLGARPVWLGVTAWPMAECAIDLRVGGALRYVWRNADGAEMTMNEVLREVVPPARLVHTELFDDDWTGGATRVTTTFDEWDGRMTMTMVIVYASKAALATALKTSMADGIAEGYGTLDALLAADPADRLP